LFIYLFSFFHFRIIICRLTVHHPVGPDCDDLHASELSFVDCVPGVEVLVPPDVALPLVGVSSLLPILLHFVHVASVHFQLLPQFVAFVPTFVAVRDHVRVQNWTYLM
jgi:hypothetical protein